MRLIPWYVLILGAPWQSKSEPALSFLIARFTSSSVMVFVPSFYKIDSFLKNARKQGRQPSLLALVAGLFQEMRLL